MKKILFFVLVGSMILALTGCGLFGEPAETQTPTFPNFQAWGEDTSRRETVPDIDPWNEHTPLWGEAQTCTVTNGKGAVTYSCNIPPIRIIHENQATVFIQCEDEKLILLGSPDDTYPAVDSLDKVFDTYLDLILLQIEDFRLKSYTDYTMALDKQEIVEISGKKMLQVRGTMTYQDEGNHRDWSFLGYATELSNGAYAYWLATYYTGNDYVGLKRITENMARSFTEVS